MKASKDAIGFVSKERTEAWTVQWWQSHWLSAFPKAAPKAIVNIRTASAVLLTCFLATGSLIAQGNRPAFALRGTFTDDFDNKPHCTGSFEVRAIGSIALIG